MYDAQYSSNRSTAQSGKIKDKVRLAIEMNSLVFGDESSITQFTDPFLQEHVESLTICDIDDLTSVRKVHVGHSSCLSSEQKDT